MKTKNIYILLLWIIFSNVSAQVLDKVIAVVGKHAIFKSDLDNQIRYAIINGEKDDGSLKCRMLAEYITNYLFLAKAENDSLEISRDAVEAEMNRRLDLMIRQAGGVEELEKIYKKPLLELKEELRPKIKEQMLIERAKEEIMAKVRIGPKDVKDFFHSLPEDSLPYFPAEVEIAHIVKYPHPSEEQKQQTLKKLNEIRKKILQGASFEDMAKQYSQDLGSAKNGGYLGQFQKGTMVPEFEEVLLSLQEGQISEAFESPFGFHIIKLHKRLGNTFEASHILLRAFIDTEAERKTKAELLRIKKLIESDSMSFAEAAKKFSEDRFTKETGGYLFSKEGSNRIPLDELDAEAYFTIEDLDEGKISDPVSYYSQGAPIKGFRIIYLKKRYPPHKAALEYDYEKFKKTLMEIKKEERVNEWIEKARKKVPVKIYDKECETALKDMFYISEK